MPKNYGVKEKDQVVSHVVNLVLTGKLRSGDRLDRNELAAQLGLSRVPVQEAVIQLEHDGVVSTRYHRGAYVERFDESVLLEHHELYGVLTGTVSARAASAATPEFLTALEGVLTSMRGTVAPRAFHDNAKRFRKTVNDAYAGPRLRTALRAAQIFMPPAFWSTQQVGLGELLACYEAEFTALSDRDPDAARAACAGRAELMGRMMVAELVRRRVLGPGSNTLVPPTTL
jgi:DNA-binding GntR family transcriptional regulator